MDRYARFSMILCAIFLCLRAVPLHAQWIYNGTGICTETNSQFEPAIINDGEGGTIIVWTDSRTYSTTARDIYAQRVDSWGRVLWTAGGVPVTTAGTDQDSPDICTDGDGGFFVVYESEEYYVGDDIFLARVDRDGNTLWRRSVATLGGSQRDSKIVSDGAGGCIVVYEDYYYTYGDLYAQRVDGAGANLWGTSPIVVSDATQHQYYVDICTDGQGGAIFAWVDLRNGVDIYAQRIDANGSYRWMVDGIPVCDQDSLRYYPQLAADGTGGAVIAWSDTRNSGINRSIYAQRVDYSGLMMWTVNGVLLSGTGDAYKPRIADDGEGGAIVVWEDRRGVSSDIYAQRIPYMGTGSWAPDGLAICTASGDQRDTEVVRDGNGGAVIAWRDGRNGLWDIYAQRVGHYSVIEWTHNGVALCTEPDATRLWPLLCPDEGGGAVAAWADTRDGFNIYAQRVERLGYWGYPSPTITYVGDVPSDQGGWVTVNFERSRLDDGGPELVEYSVWRRLSDAMTAALLERGEKGIAIERLSSAPEDSRYFFTTESGIAYGWEFLDYIPADASASYAYNAPTHYDYISPGDPGWHHFKVIAHGAEPVEFWTSPADSGYSTDNISPAPPSGGSAEQSYDPEGMQLSWDPNTEDDFSHYGLYKGTPDDTGDGTRKAPPRDTITWLGTTTETTFFDDTWRWWEESYYIITAWDRQGNESEGDTIWSGEVTGDDQPVTPRVTSLEQNYPNPFNPSTTIRFALAEPGDVTLRIYDASGRVVRTLVDGKRGAAIYEVAWDGADDGGRQVASGVYFCRFKVGDLIKTNKMILAR